MFDARASVYMMKGRPCRVCGLAAVMLHFHPGYACHVDQTSWKIVCKWMRPSVARLTHPTSINCPFQASEDDLERKRWDKRCLYINLCGIALEVDNMSNNVMHMLQVEDMELCLHMLPPQHLDQSMTNSHLYFYQDPRSACGLFSSPHQNMRYLHDSLRRPCPKGHYYSTRQTTTAASLNI